MQKICGMTSIKLMSEERAQQFNEWAMQIRKDRLHFSIEIFTQDL